MNYHLIISGTIGSIWSNCSADYVRYVLNNNKDKDVHVGFCSLGGFVKDGLEINQAFKDHGRVHAHAFGMNASIATIAMLGCQTIDIVKGSFFLIHNVSTWIEKYEQSNKEQLDNYIKQLQQERDTLKTFDDVLASMYSDKCKKSVNECLAQMKKGTWLTAQQAKDFGLVDEIREDKESEDAANQFNNQFKNYYSNSTIFKDAGIPPLPTAKDNPIADENGNPTHSFLQKTWLGLQNLIRNNQAINQKNDMIKIFASVQALLACEGFTPKDDGTIALTQEQLKKIEDQLTNQQKTINENSEAMKKASEAVKKLKDEKEKLEKDLKDRNEQINNLQNGSGEQIDKSVGDADKVVSAQDLFNLVKDV